MSKDTSAPGPVHAVLPVSDSMVLGFDPKDPPKGMPTFPTAAEVAKRTDPEPSAPAPLTSSLGDKLGPALEKATQEAEATAEATPEPAAEAVAGPQVVMGKGFRCVRTSPHVVPPPPAPAPDPAPQPDATADTEPGGDTPGSVSTPDVIERFERRVRALQGMNEALEQTVADREAKIRELETALADKERELEETRRLRTSALGDANKLRNALKRQTNGSATAPSGNPTPPSGAVVTPQPPPAETAKAKRRGWLLLPVVVVVALVVGSAFVLSYKYLWSDSVKDRLRSAQSAPVRTGTSAAAAPTVVPMTKENLVKAQRGEGTPECWRPAKQTEAPLKGSNLKLDCRDNPPVVRGQDGKRCYDLTKSCVIKVVP